MTSRDGPRRGDRVLGCAHEGDRIHWYRLVGRDQEGKPEPARFTNERTGEQFTAAWLALCTPCHRRPGTTEEKAATDFVLDGDIDVSRRPAAHARRQRGRAGRRR